MPIILTKCIPFSKTVKVPSSHSVGSGPRENINLNIVEATKVLIPVSFGNDITSAADDIIAAQIRADIVELNSKNIALCKVI